MRRPLAAEPARGLRPGGVAVEARELDVPVGPVLDELEGPGADELLELPVPGRVDDLLRVDRREARDGGQHRREHRRRLLQADLDHVRPLRLHRLDRLEDRLAGAGDLPPALERGDHVGGRQLLAVVELHALAEADDVALGAVERVVALGEERDRLVLRVERVERLEHVDADLAGDRRRRRVRVERRRLADHPDPEDAALPRRLGARLGQPERRRDQHQGQERGKAERTWTQHGGSLPPPARGCPVDLGEARPVVGGTLGRGLRGCQAAPPILTHPAARPSAPATSDSFPRGRASRAPGCRRPGTRPRHRGAPRSRRRGTSRWGTRLRRSRCRGS